MHDYPENKQKEPFSSDPKMLKKIADCKKAFQKWELDKMKRDRVNPAKKFKLFPSNSTLGKLSKFDKIVLLTVGVYVIWVLVTLLQMDKLRGIEYMDTPPDVTNSTNLTYHTIDIECKLGIEVCKYV